MILNESTFNTNWATKTLTQLGVFKRGVSKHRPRNDKRLFEDGKYPLVQTGEIKGANLYIRNHNATYNEFGLKQSKIWPKGTLCITIAANIAETALLGYPMCFPDSIVGYNADTNESSELFMHYVFTYIRETIQNTAIGSIQDNINVDYLTNLRFKIPEKEYQEKIVFILSSIDLKIELNNKINAELEGLAKLVYDYWFVQFDFPNGEGKPFRQSGGKMRYDEVLRREVPEEWEVKFVGKEFKVVLGGTPSTTNKSYWQNGDIPWLNSGEIINFPIINSEEKITKAAIKESNTELMPKGTVLISITRHLRPSILAIDACANQSVVGIYESSEVKNTYLYPFLKNEIPRYMTLRTGAQQPHINKSTIEETSILIPPQKILESYHSIVKPMYDKIVNCAFENQQLTELRDWLLPLLMNGQVGVG